MRADARDTTCPECEARPGEDCVYWYYGQPYSRHDLHEARQDAADEAAYEASL